MIFIQPSIDPVIFSLGFVEIRWYSLAYILGLLIGLFLIKKLNKIKGSLLSNKDLDNFLIWAVIGIVLGGRIGYVLFYQTSLFFTNPIYVLEIWNGGMSFHGGLLGLIISIYYFTRLYKIKFFYLSDLVSIVSPIGLFLGRLANFVNTELIGRPTDFYIAIIYPSIDNLKRHPSQLYEAFFEGIVLFIILLFYFNKFKKLRNYGAISGLFLFFYGTFRFLIEFLREPDHQIGLIINLITMGQILCIPLIIFGNILIYKYYGFRKRN
ncbi:prolipoprotein diacylglyceryl transferase [Pelagibacteraceae bacterium]|nr:prolipoprotein diacylglyceryl transferase [Pelagibacteraceae bacterium]